MGKNVLAKITLLNHLYFFWIILFRGIVFVKLEMKPNNKASVERRSQKKAPIYMSAFFRKNKLIIYNNFEALTICRICLFNEIKPAI